jgi:hypothetical protein
MTPGSGIGDYSRQVGKAAAHRRPRKRSALTRVVAAGGAVVCIGAAYEVTAPTVHALSIVFRAPDGNGGTNETRINILQGNIFDPQLGLLGPNVSNNSTSADGVKSTPNNFLVNNPIFDNPITRFINALLSAEIVIGGAASGPINNSTQFSFFSFNIFNPQASIFGGNLSNNTAIANKASGQGNYAASPTSVPNFWTSWFGGMSGNGNVMQFALLSGNIFNPQWSIFGPNVSNNTALTNVADQNGNYSQTVATGGGFLGAVISLFLGGLTGNGNTTQAAVGTSNITNPQVSIGGSNLSNNTAVTNEASGNGNNSQTTSGVISTGTTGNGNTNQAAVGASNIENTQVSAGDVGLTPRPQDLSASQSGSQLTTTSTTPTTNSTSPTSSLSSSGSTGSSTQTGSTSAGESGGSSVGTTGTSTGTSTGTGTGTSGTSGTSSTTGTSGTSGTSSTTGTGITSGSGSTSGSGGTGESGGSGGSGGSGTG